MSIAVAGNVGFVILAPGAGLGAMFSKQPVVGVGLIALALLRISVIPSPLRVLREKNPHLILGPGSITINDGATFAGPQFIHRDRIREIVVGPGVTERFANAGASRPWFVLLTPHLASPNSVLILTEPARAIWYHPEPAFGDGTESTIRCPSGRPSTSLAEPVASGGLVASFVASGERAG